MERTKDLCLTAGIDFSSFMRETEIELMNRVKWLLTPGEKWFDKGKSIKRYWKYLEKVTNHEWKYEDADHWYGYLRNPSETREEIPISIRYQVLTRDDSTCQKCGARAPDVGLHVDHILPWNCGGPTVIDNLWTLCEKCNIGKSDTCFEGGDEQ